VMRRCAPHLVAAYCNALREVFVRGRRWWPGEERFARVWKWLGGGGGGGWDGGGDGGWGREG